MDARLTDMVSCGNAGIRIVHVVIVIVDISPDSVL